MLLALLDYLIEEEKKKKRKVTNADLPRLFPCPVDEVLKMRCKYTDEEGEEVWSTYYSDFVLYFLPWVVGKSDRWKDNFKTKLLSEFATKTDEAFAIFLLENNIKRWFAAYIAERKERREKVREEFKEIQDEQKKTKGGGKGNRGNNSSANEEAHNEETKNNPNRSAASQVDVATKWTNSKGGLKGSNKKYNGWSEEGTNRFNELVKMVKINRRRNADFDTWFLEKMKQNNKKGDSQNEASNEETPKAVVVKAYNELWDDDDEEEEQEHEGAESSSSSSDSSSSSSGSTATQPPRPSQGNQNETDGEESDS